MKKNKWFAALAAMVMALAVAGCQIDSDRHEHSFSSDWTSDATDHWHAATCEHTKEVSGKIAHTFGEWKTTVEATEETEGKKERSCSVCSYKEEQSLAKLNHTHKFSSDWTSNATDHWHAATCEHAEEVKDKTEHTFGEWTSNNDATKTADGTKSRTCIACSYKETVTDEGSKLPDYSTCVVGDFILKDGTILGKDETPASGTVAAVIVRAAADDQPALGVGIVHNKMAWCTSSASGYSNNITDLNGDETSGYIDGSNSWALLVAACYDLKYATAETIETVAQKYPAFNYCRKYGTSKNLTGDLAKGWYLPTVAELYTIYKNKETVNASLSKAGGSQFGRVSYWSCCSCYDYYSWVLSFTNRGDISYFKKSYDTYCVCSVRAFN